jgi:hypothetical protein
MDGELHDVIWQIEDMKKIMHGDPRTADEENANQPPDTLVLADRFGNKIDEFFYSRLNDRKKYARYFSRTLTLLERNCVGACDITNKLCNVVARA